MSVKASEISDLIKSRIENFQSAQRSAHRRHRRHGHRRHHAASTAWPTRATAK